MKVPNKSNRDGLMRDTVWNAISNVAAAGLSAWLLLLASRISGAYWCGVLALGLAMSQQLYTLGNFTMGSYQASDVAEKRAFGDYVVAKCLSLAAMWLVAVAWLLRGDFGRDKEMVFLPLLVYQTSDAFSNAFFARYQQKGRLDLACKIRFSKILSFCAAYATTAWTMRSPILSLWVATAVHVGLFVVLDVPRLRKFGPLHWRLPGRASLTILAACSPLAANSFLTMYVNNGPRFAVDAVLGEETLAAYGALFMVSFAVAVCGDFLMNPQVVRLAEAVRRRDRTSACKIVWRQSVIILGLGATGLAVGAAAGIPVLSWLFGLDLNGRRMVLLILLSGGILLTFYQLGQTVLVVLRRQAWGMPGMLLAVATVSLFARPAVIREGLTGAAAVYVCAVALMALSSIIFAARFFRATFGKGIA